MDAGLTTNSALALAVGVAESTIGRVLTGQVEVSAAFIASLLGAFPGTRFDDLFEVVANPQQP
jgi:plasmid maintenance system antidote protein VapI